MEDLVTASILFAKSKGKIGDCELIVRYLSIKYHLKISREDLSRRILFLEMQKPFSVN